jgi:hypothetical protein
MPQVNHCRTPAVHNRMKRGKLAGRLCQLYSEKYSFADKEHKRYWHEGQGLRSLILMLQTRNLRFGEMNRKVFGRQV